MKEETKKRRNGGRSLGRKMKGMEGRGIEEEVEKNRGRNERREVKKEVWEEEKREGGLERDGKEGERRVREQE